MKLTFRQIEVFQAVITASSLSEAAQFLGVSQPAVSRLVADFEAQVGFLLFQKSGRALQATPEAWLLLEEVRRAYSGLDRVREAATAIRDFRDGKLDLIATPAAVRQMANRWRGRPAASPGLPARRAGGTAAAGGTGRGAGTPGRSARCGW